MSYKTVISGCIHVHRQVATSDRLAEAFCTKVWSVKTQNTGRKRQISEIDRWFARQIWQYVAMASGEGGFPRLFRLNIHEGVT